MVKTAKVLKSHPFIMQTPTFPCFRRSLYVTQLLGSVKNLKTELPCFHYRLRETSCIHITFDAQRGERALMPHANSESLDERAHSCSLIRTFFIR